MSLFPSTARSGLAGLRSTPSATAMLRRSFTPLAARVQPAVAARQPTSLSTMHAAQNASAALATAMIVRPFTHSSKTSNVKIAAVSQSEALKMLNEQRSLRPNSPHMTIYQPQATWYLSILTRMTGVGLSAMLYVWAISYLALPYTGVGQVLSSAHLVQYAALAPLWLKLTVKVPLAFAFSYHSLNGIRHLFWDVGRGLSLKGVYLGAYIVSAASVAATVALCML